MNGSKEKLRPLGDGVLVRVEKAQETSAGGIIIPDNAKEKPRRGEVLAVGPGTPLEGFSDPVNTPARIRKVAVEPGAVVLFGQFTGTQVGEDDGLLLLKESDLLAVVEQTPTSGLRAELDHAATSASGPPLGTLAQGRS